MPNHGGGKCVSALSAGWRILTAVFQYFKTQYNLGVEFYLTIPRNPVCNLKIHMP